ncbi:hypothetical protein M5K25_018437 [Dendrobium thyrsiflorum]|uniref:Uncharacterized protein n=1 Tax=Dendrobium thyrsiflorum TaxID=117978 RepID=A0ABD0UHX6_DENTH
MRVSWDESLGLMQKIYFIENALHGGNWKNRFVSFGGNFRWLCQRSKEKARRVLEWRSLWICEEISKRYSQPHSTSLLLVAWRRRKHLCNISSYLFEAIQLKKEPFVVIWNCFLAIAAPEAKAIALGKPPKGFQRYTYVS